MALSSEFKAFLSRGNAIDLAIGVVIGLAFGKVVSSLVTDVLMPPLGLLIGGIDFSALSIPLKPATAGAPAVAIRIGVFINAIIDFIIIAASIFVIVKLLTTLKIKKVDETQKNCPECQMSIPASAKKCGHCTSVIN